MTLKKEKKKEGLLFPFPIVIQMQAVDPQWVDITAVLNKGPLLMSLRQLLWFTSTLSQLGMEKKKKKNTKVHKQLFQRQDSKVTRNSFIHILLAKS